MPLTVSMPTRGAKKPDCRLLSKGNVKDGVAKMGRSLKRSCKSFAWMVLSSSLI